jgi:hypothetical protein
VLRLDARAKGQNLPFAYVREQIADYLTEKRWRRDVAAYIDQIVSQAHIEGIDMSCPHPAKVDAA